MHRFSFFMPLSSLFGKRLDDGEHVKSYAVSAVVFSLVISSRAFYYLNALNRLYAPMSIVIRERELIFFGGGLNVKRQRFPG